MLSRRRFLAASGGLLAAGATVDQSCFRANAGGRMAFEADQGGFSNRRGRAKRTVSHVRRIHEGQVRAAVPV